MFGNPFALNHVHPICQQSNASLQDIGDQKYSASMVYLLGKRIEKLKMTFLFSRLKSINSVCNSGAIVDLSGEDQTTKSYQGQGIEALEWLNKNRTISDRLEGNSSFGVIHRYRTNASTNDSLSLIFFSRTTETLQFQQMLSRIRYHWFRKLSRSPLNAGFERVFDESRNILNINYQPKHMATKECLHVDEIIFNSDLLRDQMDVAEKHCQQFDVTVCKSNLDKCLLAFLDDAFTVKNNQLVSLFLSSTSN